MAGTFKFELVSPERILMSVDAEQVLLPGAEGLFTVFVDHAPVISSLIPGVIHLTTADAKTAIYVNSGFAEVTGDQVTVLAERAFIVEEVDPRQLDDEMDAAQKALDEADTDEARRHVNRAIEELKALVSEKA
ncbi:MAG: F0F1 ATP synthase subunit epsilon [Alphaproteobacteria bacterium]|nr:F0F1 ATP synthase subunit epsilon [Alphaproteobacteria bacterium]